jgi:long-chain fatty acid transport protein
LINVDGGFRQDTTMRRYAGNVPTAKAPHFFLNSVDGKVAYGIGVYAPYGLTSQWNGDFPGRFEALKTSLKTIYVQPNVAYAISPTWSVGGGVIYGHSDVELDQALDLSAQLAQPGGPTFGQLGIAAGTQFATAKVTGSASGWGYNLGIHGKLSSDWSVGARYLSHVRFSYDNAKATFTQDATGLTLSAGNPLTGTVTPVDALVQGQFSGTGALTPQGASTVIDHPWQAQAGVGFTGLPNTTLSADVARIGWSSFNTLPLNFSGNASASDRVLLEDYHDIWSYRFGAEYAFKTGNMQGVILRGGYSYAQTPAPDETVTPLLPDMPRQNGSIGIGVPLAQTSMLDFSYLHVSTAGRRGRITERTSEAQTAAELNSGSYDLQANVFSLSLTTHF